MTLKRLLLMASIALTISLALCGCAKKKAGEGTGASSGDYFLNYDFAGEAQWQDNTLDAYEAKYVIPLKALSEEELKDLPKGHVLVKIARKCRLI